MYPEYSGGLQYERLVVGKEYLSEYWGFDFFDDVASERINDACYDVTLPYDFARTAHLFVDACHLTLYVYQVLFVDEGG